MLLVAWFIIAFLIGGFIALWGYRRKAVIINDDTTYGETEGARRFEGRR